VTRSAWLDPKGIRFAVGFAILAALANGVWILLDHTTPSWDQAYYLTDTFQYRVGFADGGVHGLLSAIHSTDPAHGPLFTTSMLPFFYAFGNSPRSGLLLNLALAPVFYFAAGQIAWIVFRNWVARLTTILLVATMPLLVGLYHEVLQDFLLVTLTTVSVLLLLMSDRFRSRWFTLGLGAAMGLGTLAKVTFPIFVVGPLIAVAVEVVLTATREERESRLAALRPQVRNVLWAAALYLVLVLPWYLSNLSETAEYVRSTTSGPLSEGAGPTDPFTFHAFASFTTGMVNTAVSWVIVLAGLIAIALCLPALRALRRRRPRQVERLTDLALLGSWALIPYLLIVTAHNQDVRLMAPAMPAMAIIVAGAISAVRQRRVRLALISCTALLLVYQGVNHTTAITPSFLPDDLTLHVGSYEATIPLNEEQIGFQRLPGEDYATPVIERIEQIARSEQRGFGPRTICMLETEPVVNTNTFTFLAKTRGDPFQYWDIFVGPNSAGSLRETLQGCDFALYVKQPKVNPADAGERITIVNEEYAARHMTPGLFALFRGPRNYFPVAPSAEEGSGSSNEYLSTSGRSDRVLVLTREPGAE
jgi:4-amino-4-deoxy-L-arabinose transferase-like glycosyltransferase